MVLAVAHPWASASSYLSSQSLADSRCNPHATPRSSYSRRSPSCRFFLCRAALPCLVPQRHRRLSVPCSRGFSCLSAQFPGFDGGLGVTGMMVTVRGCELMFTPLEQLF